MRCLQCLSIVCRSIEGVLEMGRIATGSFESWFKKVDQSLNFILSVSCRQLTIW